MKKLYIFLIIICVILIIVGIGWKTDIVGYVIKDGKYSFKDGLKEVREIEEDFNFDQGYPELIDDKWSMLGYLSNIQNYVENLPKDEETNALYHYMFFRTRELKSKIKYQLATKYKLTILEDGTLICPKEEVFKERMQNFNESVELGYEAIEHLNTLINDYPKYFEMTKIDKILPKLMEAQYYQIEEDRKEEEEIITRLCFS